MIHRIKGKLGEKSTLQGSVVFKGRAHRLASSSETQAGEGGGAGRGSAPTMWPRWAAAPACPPAGQHWARYIHTHTHTHTEDSAHGHTHTHTNSGNSNFLLTEGTWAQASAVAGQWLGPGPFGAASAFSETGSLYEHICIHTHAHTHTHIHSGDSEHGYTHTRTRTHTHSLRRR
uniref:Uncharacterized protein n=1 Tax=Myotis myotis TaxID=51298 RepID=A0A7J8AN03_MYOMY|nr:hypothetical protein mMyoMyo1_007976 [Myotis myotis]